MSKCSIFDEIINYFQKIWDNFNKKDDYIEFDSEKDEDEDVISEYVLIRD
jgi:hypothetical protein